MFVWVGWVGLVCWVYWVFWCAGMVMKDPRKRERDLGMLRSEVGFFGVGYVRLER